MHLAVGFDPRHTGGHVDLEAVAAQHVLALGQHHATRHGDEVGLGVEYRRLPGHHLILLRDDDGTLRFQPADR